MGQPTVLITGPANLSPYPYSSTAPVRIEMIEKEMAKFEKPPISRKSCCPYPRLARYASSDSCWSCMRAREKVASNRAQDSRQFLPPRRRGASRRAGQEVE